MTITETREVFAAFTALTLRYQDAMKDGKLSWYEMAGFLTEVKPVKRALERVHEVPAELLDISPDELPAITADITNILAAWGISHRHQDAVAVIAGRLPVLIDMAKNMVAEARLLFAELQALPPSAEAV